MNEEAQTTVEHPAIQVVPEKKKRARLEGHLKIGPARPIGRSNKMLNWAAKTFPQVKVAHDAYTPIRIRVQSRDATAAKQKAPNECAFAKAACRELDADGAYIGIKESCVIVGNKVIRFQTPESVRREIVSFDRHRDFRAGEYQLSAVCPGRRLGVRGKEPARWKPSGKKTGKGKGMTGVVHRTVSIRRSVRLEDIR